MTGFSERIILKNNGYLLGFEYAIDPLNKGVYMCFLCDFLVIFDTKNQNTVYKNRVPNSKKEG